MKSTLATVENDVSSQTAHMHMRSLISDFFFRLFNTLCFFIGITGVANDLKPMRGVIMVWLSFNDDTTVYVSLTGGEYYKKYSVVYLYSNTYCFIISFII